MNTEVPNPDSIHPGEQLAGAFDKASRRMPPFLHQLLQLFVIALLAVGSYLAVSHFFLQSVRVVGSSMFPTLHDADRYLLNRWVFYVRSPQRGEVVVLRDPQDKGCSVKRVIGVAGDAIALRNGQVYLNGKRLEESYLPAGTPTFSLWRPDEQFYQCRSDQCFVLGDNRTDSVDSRTYGPVSRKNILGLVIR